MVGKALGLLVLLGDEPRGASAAELSRRAELPFSTTYRLLGSLTRDGFVDYEPDGRRYHLGLRVFQLGQRVSNHHGFAGTALPILRRVTEKTGEATILSVRDGHHHLTVNKVDGPADVPRHQRSGAPRRPPHHVRGQGARGICRGCRTPAPSGIGSATAEDPPLIFAGEGRAGPLTFPPAEPPPAA